MLINMYVVYIHVIVYLFPVVEHGKKCLIDSYLQATRHLGEDKSIHCSNDESRLW